MRTARGLILGFLMGLAAAGPSCGRPCDAFSCPTGCCDLDGRCTTEPGYQMPEGHLLCGSLGSRCANCPSGYACQSGSCWAPGTSSAR